MARQAPPHRGFTLVELMVVIAIIGILAAIAFPKVVSYILSSRLETAKPYMTSIASRLKENRNQYGSFLAGNESTYRTAPRDEQLLENYLGVNLKDAADFCFMVQLGTATSTDTGAKGTNLANGEFEVWAVLRDGSYSGSTAEDDVVTVDDVTASCRTAGDGTNSDDKLGAVGWFDSTLEGKILVYKYPPPANDLYWNDGFRMDNPLGTLLSAW